MSSVHFSQVALPTDSYLPSLIFLTRKQTNSAGAKILVLLAEQSAPPFLSSRGPNIKDVRTEGGRGVGPKADIVREVE